MRIPNNPIVLIWTLGALSVNTASIFIVYYEAAFRLKAVENISSGMVVLEVIMMLEVLFFFFKAYPAKESHRGWIFSICPCKKKQSKERDTVGGNKKGK